jgi:chemotaxis response regulator CheB
MRLPQIVIYESDGWLAAQVGDLARENGWLVRESRHADACLNFLRECRPSVLLLKVEPKLIDEMTLLAALTEKVPECPVVVCSDAKLESAEQRSHLAGLACDLGARFIMFPPLTRNVVEDVASGLMAATIARMKRGDE